MITIGEDEKAQKQRKRPSCSMAIMAVRVTISIRTAVHHNIPTPEGAVELQCTVYSFPTASSSTNAPVKLAISQIPPTSLLSLL